MGSTTRARYLLLAVVAIVTVGVLAMSWPRFQASFRYLPVDLAIKRYYVEREIPSYRLAVLIAFAEQAVQLHDHYRYRDGLSLLHYLQALDPYTPALERRPAYRKSEAQARVSLSQAPAQSATWLRLAAVRWTLHDEPEAIIQPWKMSVFTARTNTSLLASRVELGLAYYLFLDQEGISMLRDQVLLAWRVKRGALVRVLARRDGSLDTTRMLLAETHPLALQDMERWLEEIR